MRDSVKTRARLQKAVRNTLQRVLILGSAFSLFLLGLVAIVVVVKVVIG